MSKDIQIVMENQEVDENSSNLDENWLEDEGNGGANLVEDGGWLIDPNESQNMLVPYQEAKWYARMWDQFKVRMAPILAVFVIFLLIVGCSVIINFVEDEERSNENHAEMCQMIKTALKVAKDYLRDHGKQQLFRLLPLYLRLELQELVISTGCSSGEHFDNLNFTSINQCCN